MSLDLKSLLRRYHNYWMLYRQGAHYLDNLFSYFNRVSGRGYIIIIIIIIIITIGSPQ